jgi:hypothetical protein
MLTVSELKRRVGIILGIEEHGDQADWFAIRNLSVELLQELPESAPRIVRCYLTDSDIRRVSPGFANSQHLELVQYLRSPDGGGISEECMSTGPFEASRRLC